MSYLSLFGNCVLLVVIKSAQAYYGYGDGYGKYGGYRYGGGDQTFEYICNSLPFSSVYKWDMCFTTEGLGSYGKASCQKFKNGQLATGFSAAELKNILSSVYDETMPPNFVSVNDSQLTCGDNDYCDYAKFDMNDGWALQEGDVIEVVGRWTPGVVGTFQIDFLHDDGQERTRHDLIMPLILYFDFMAFIKPEDSLTCIHWNAGGTAWQEEEGNVGFVGKTDFVIAVMIQASSYQIWLDDRKLLTCDATHYPISAINAIWIWGRYTDRIGTVIHSVRRGDHVYGGQAFLWLNMRWDTNAWIWKSNQSLDSDIKWADNEPHNNLDGDKKCILVNANNGELIDTNCQATAPALCMYGSDDDEDYGEWGDDGGYGGYIYGWGDYGVYDDYGGYSGYDEYGEYSGYDDYRQYGGYDDDGGYGGYDDYGGYGGYDDYGWGDDGGYGGYIYGWGDYGGYDDYGGYSGYDDYGGYSGYDDYGGYGGYDDYGGHSGYDDYGGYGGYDDYGWGDNGGYGGYDYRYDYGMEDYLGYETYDSNEYGVDSLGGSYTGVYDHGGTYESEDMPWKYEDSPWSGLVEKGAGCLHMSVVVHVAILFFVILDAM